MSKNYKIFVSCDQANHVCDKTQYKEASLWEKIKLNIHLMYCAACRKYTSNNSKLTKLVKNSEVQCMELNEKTSLKDAFENELQNYQ